MICFVNVGIVLPSRCEMPQSWHRRAKAPITGQMRTERPTSTAPERHPNGVEAELMPDPEASNRTVQTTRVWAIERRFQRLRREKRMGLPEKEKLAQWAPTLAT